MSPTESRNRKIQYVRQAAILKVTSLKINRLLPMATINMHLKFEIEIPKQTWLMLRKPCHLQTDGRSDGRMDGRTRWIQYTPPPTSLEGGIIKICLHFYSMVVVVETHPHGGQGLNSLWPSDTIWRHVSGSTLAQIMAWCLAAPNHYLNHCSLFINGVLRHSGQEVNLWNEIQIHFLNYCHISQGSMG